MSKGQHRYTRWPSYLLAELKRPDDLVCLSTDFEKFS